MHVFFSEPSALLIIGLDELFSVIRGQTFGNDARWKVVNATNHK